MISLALSPTYGASLSIRCSLLILIAIICWLEPYLLPERSVTAVMMVAGQAHFFMAYLYQYRAGRMDVVYWLRYLPVALVLIGAQATFGLGDLPVLLTSVYFTLHFFYDERFLLKDEPSLDGWWPALPTIILLTSEVLHRFEVFTSSWLIPGALAAAIALALLQALRMWRRRELPTGRDLYFLLVFLFANALVAPGRLTPGPINPNVINFIVLAHFANWYLNFFLRYHGNRRLRERFVFSVFIINGLSAILFTIYLGWGSVYFLAGLLGALFSQSGFYISSLLHYTATFRASDLRNWLP